jgi:hypothetical protein
MDTRKGLDIYEVLGWMLMIAIGVLSGFLLREYLRKRKRGGKKRQGKKS